MKRMTAIALSVLFLLASGPGAGAQQNPPPKPKQPGQQKRPDDTTRITTLTVRLPITVKEKDKFVGGLRVSNFQVYEDGKLQKIDKFETPSPLPLSVAVLMDTSNSVKLKLPFEKEAAEGFVADVTTFRKKDQVLFATFDSDVELHQDFTDAQEPLIRAIRKVKAGGYTRMYDAIYRVIEEKLANLEGESRRIIVVLSDGADTASERKLREAIEMAQRYDVTIFGISTKNFTGSGVSAGMVESSDDKELRVLCEATGGQVFLPSERVELFRAFARVAQDLRNEYVIFYTPQNQESLGKRREIKVKLIGQDGRPYHKQGYTY